MFCFKVLSNGILAGAFSDSTIRIWNVETSQLLATFQSDETILAIEGAMRGYIYFTCGTEIKELNWKTSKVERVLTGHTDSVLCLLRLNKSLLASGSDDCMIKLWNAENGSLFITLKGHTSSVEFLDNLKNNFLVSCSQDSCIRIWNVFYGECVLKIDTKIDYLNSLSANKNDEIAVGSGSKINIFKINFN